MKYNILQLKYIKILITSGTFVDWGLFSLIKTIFDLEDNRAKTTSIYLVNDNWPKMS